MLNNKHLKEYYENMNDNQKQLVSDMVHLMNKGADKRKIIEVFNQNFPEEKIVNYDTAVPVDLIKHLREAYPNVSNGAYVFDYTKNKFGTLVNVNDLFMRVLYKTIYS